MSNVGPACSSRPATPESRWGDNRGFESRRSRSKAAANSGFSVLIEDAAGSPPCSVDEEGETPEQPLSALRKRHVCAGHRGVGEHELLRSERGVAAVPGDELGVCAALDDSARFEDEDLVPVF